MYNYVQLSSGVARGGDGGGKIEVIPKNKNREDLKKVIKKIWGGGGQKII